MTHRYRFSYGSCRGVTFDVALDRTYYSQHYHHLFVLVMIVVVDLFCWLLLLLVSFTYPLHCCFCVIAYHDVHKYFKW